MLAFALLNNHSGRVMKDKRGAVQCFKNPGLPSAPALSTCLVHPTWAGDLFHP